MKKILNLLFLSMLLMLTALSSCTNIDDDEHYTYVKPADVNRCVLIEDFTGQRCRNCPTATYEIEKLQEQYGADVVIAVGIHSGPLGFKGNAKVAGLATDLDDTYYNFWKCDHQPIGLVNRGGLCEYTSWAAEVRKAVGQKAPLDLKLTINSYDNDTRRVKLTADAHGTNGTTAGKLQLWVLEDSITAMQTMPDGKPNADYVHMHVLRAAINGDWGQDITVREGQTVPVEAEFNIDEKWDPKHVSIVAFVYNPSGVMQVTKKALLKPQQAKENNHYKTR